MYLLVIFDWFTKFTLLYPLKKATATKIVEIVENNVFLMFGVPQLIICDNGVQFRSNEFKNLAAKYKVDKIWYNANYHPQVNPVERVNRVIKTAVRAYVTENHRLWDRDIQKIAQGIRTAVHEVTGYSPTFLNFGRYVPTTGDYFGKYTSTQVNIGERNKLVDGMSQLSQFFIGVRQRLHQAYEKAVPRYNLRRRPLQFNIGDRVWRRNYTLSNAGNYYSAKLAPLYVPAVVLRKLSNLAYELADKNGRSVGVWHIKDMKENPQE